MWGHVTDRLEVNLAGLDDLAIRLERICTALDGAKDFFAGYEDALGDHELVNAAHHFESHWKDGRKHIKDSASSLQAMAAESAQAYREADNDLASSLSKAAEQSHGGPQ
jgi:hypothetical protein